jgi:hypothetical protein
MTIDIEKDGISLSNKASNHTKAKQVKKINKKSHSFLTSVAVPNTEGRFKLKTSSVHLLSLTTGSLHFMDRRANMMVVCSLASKDFCETASFQIFTTCFFVLLAIYTIPSPRGILHTLPLAAQSRYLLVLVPVCRRDTVLYLPVNCTYITQQ